MYLLKSNKVVVRGCLPNRAVHLRSKTLIIFERSKISHKYSLFS